MFNNLQQLEASDYSIRFLAEVVDVQDPLRKGRIKIKIPRMLETYNPWVFVTQSIGPATETAPGFFAVPGIGAIVVVKFEREDLDFGICEGVAVTARTQLGALETNYPNRYGFVDGAGNHFFVDTTEGQRSVELRHTSGTTIRIGNDGALTVTSSGPTNIDVQGSATITSTTSMNLKSSGALTLESGSAMKLKAPRIDFEKG